MEARSRVRVAVPVVGHAVGGEPVIGGEVAVGGGVAGGVGGGIEEDEGRRSVGARAAVDGWDGGVGPRGRPVLRHGDLRRVAQGECGGGGEVPARGVPDDPDPRGVDPELRGVRDDPGEGRDAVEEGERERVLGGLRIGHGDDDRAGVDGESAGRDVRDLRGPRHPASAGQHEERGAQGRFRRGRSRIRGIRARGARGSRRARRGGRPRVVDAQRDVAGRPDGEGVADRGDGDRCRLAPGEVDGGGARLGEGELRGGDRIAARILREVRARLIAQGEPGHASDCTRPPRPPAQRSRQPIAVPNSRPRAKVTAAAP